MREMILGMVATTVLTATVAGAAGAQERVTITGGVLEGTRDAQTGLSSFKGIPFAAPPVGDLRWKAPQPVKAWSGVRKADTFGARAMQLPMFGDMGFRASGMSEDCLYLNVWTPTKINAWTSALNDREKLPVLVYFYGGGFVAGDGSEPRYDGASMAQKGIVVVTVNYRLGVFGFFAHPDLTKESPNHASGNYGLLDQNAALKWVRQNIARFGGDPKRVTIAGESAGSISVSAQMASPLSKGLFARAIGESGSILGALSAVPLANAEANGVKVATGVGGGKALSLAELRALPAEQLMQTAAKSGFAWFTPTVDGYFLPKSPFEIYTKGEQAHVPLLAGVNSEESGYGSILEREKPTVENYRAALTRLYPDKADAVFKLYPATTDTEVMDAAQALASDRFISYSTWKWVDLVTKTGKQPTYYYVYTHPRPAIRAELGDVTPGLAGGITKNTQPPANRPPSSRGAVHSAEIEYALGNLDGNAVYAWTEDDRKVSHVMQSYFANFIKSADPNGSTLPTWPRFTTEKHLVLDITPRAQPNTTLRPRYDFLDRSYTRQ